MIKIKLLLSFIMDQYSTPISELHEPSQIEQEIHYNDTDTMNTSAKYIAERLNQELKQQQSNPPQAYNDDHLHNVIDSKQQQINYLTNKHLIKLTEFNRNEYIALAFIIIVVISPQFMESVLNKFSFLVNANPLLLVLIKAVLILGTYHVLKKLVL